MITTPDGVALYTEEDVQALFNQNAQNYEDGKGFMHKQLRKEAIEYFKSVVKDGLYPAIYSKDEAENIFNGLADALGWERTTLTTLFTVCVDFNGMTIAEFADVEADDEDGAIEEVRSNLSIDSVETHFDLSYNNDTQSNSVNVTYYFEEDFEYTAVEQG